jgi:hypothetical protein
VIDKLIDRFEKNSHGFWREYRFFIALFFSALTLDGISTMYTMLKEGPHVELHPVIKIVSIIIGPILGPLLSVIAKAVAGIIVAIYCRRFAFHIFIAASIISTLAACYNIWGINLYASNIIRTLQNG